MNEETLHRLTQSNIMLVEALAMHWENEKRKLNNESIAYDEVSFYDLINRCVQ